MTLFPRWRPPASLPPEAELHPDGTRLRMVPNPAVPASEVLPTPLVATEAATWTRPSGSASFSLHPLGVLHLYSRAWSLLHEAAGDEDWPEEQVAAAAARVWLLASRVFEPGRAIRSRLDAVIDAGGLNKSAGPPLGQLEQLASWAVVQAAVVLAKEAGA